MLHVERIFGIDGSLCVFARVINRNETERIVVVDLQLLFHAGAEVNELVLVVVLQNEIAIAISGTTEPTAVLRVDKAVAVQDLVTLLDIGNKLKIKMILATDTK